MTPPSPCCLASRLTAPRSSSPSFTKMDQLSSLIMNVTTTSKTGFASVARHPPLPPTARPLSPAPTSMCGATSPCSPMSPSWPTLTPNLSRKLAVVHGLPLLLLGALCTLLLKQLPGLRSKLLHLKNSRMVLVVVLIKALEVELHVILLLTTTTTTQTRV